MDNSFSSQSRYDHFDTAPFGRTERRHVPYNFISIHHSEHFFKGLIWQYTI